MGALLEVARTRMEVTGRTRPGFVRPRAMMRWAHARKQRPRNGLMARGGHRARLAPLLGGRR
ncbi:hypothetical protein HMPREF1317_2186 [Schaalia georgiae F0490]|uniref:Uncharacterized protein n=1 Tax=Schaalia georgiae F0490 TaxID=1125717 RepID=J1HNW1_9ACTO|nr:hypothetical protein HMPREF1317_2186 [Schaalia georgiae F0490]